MRQAGGFWSTFTENGGGPENEPNSEFYERSSIAANAEAKLTARQAGRLIVESTALLLRLYGHEVDTALGGRAAISHMHDTKPDVAILDISMPEMNGLRGRKEVA